MGKQQVCVECAATPQRAITAARVGHLECLQAAFAAPGVLNERDSFGATPIHYAARQGQLACVKWLCEHSGLSPNSAARNGATPAHDAAATGHVDCLGYLLKETKCDANDKTNEGATVLQLTCRFGKARVLKYLLAEKIVNPKDKAANDVTAVHICAAKDNLSCMKVLTRHEDYVPNEVTKSGATPVYFAAQEGSFRCLRWLVERCQGDALLRATDGMAPIHAAASSGHLLCMRYLIESAGISSRMRSAEGATPVHYCAAAGKIESLQWLLDMIKGKKLDRDLSGGTAIHDAAELGQAESLRVFLRRGYRVDEADDEGVTAVDLARENNHQESVDLLLGTGDLGSDVKFDLRNPGAAIRKASSAAAQDDKREAVLAAKSAAEPKRETATPTKAAKSTSSAKVGDISADGVDGPRPADAAKSRPLPPPPPPGGVPVTPAAAATTPVASVSVHEITPSNDSTVDIHDDTVLSAVEGVMSDTDDDLDESNPKAYKRRSSLASFFTNMRRKVSSSSLVEAAPASPPPTDGADAEKKRKRFKLPKLKRLWRSQSSLDGSPVTSPTSKKSKADLGVVEETIEPEQAIMVSDKELDTLAAAEAEENASIADVPRPKPPTETEEEKAEKKRRELEERLADEERQKDKEGEGNVEADDDDVWEPVPANLLAELRRRNEEESTRTAAPDPMPQYGGDDDDDDDDDLLAAMEEALESTVVESTPGDAAEITNTNDDEDDGGVKEEVNVELPSEESKPVVIPETGSTGGLATVEHSTPEVEKTTESSDVPVASAVDVVVEAVKSPEHVAAEPVAVDPLPPAPPAPPAPPKPEMDNTPGGEDEPSEKLEDAYASDSMSEGDETTYDAPAVDEVDELLDAIQSEMPEEEEEAIPTGAVSIESATEIGECDAEESSEHIEMMLGLRSPAIPPAIVDTEVPQGDTAEVSDNEKSSEAEAVQDNQVVDAEVDVTDGDIDMLKQQEAVTSDEPEEQVTPPVSESVLGETNDRARDSPSSPLELVEDEKPDVTEADIPQAAGQSPDAEPEVVEVVIDEDQALHDSANDHQEEAVKLEASEQTDSTAVEAAAALVDSSVDVYDEKSTDLAADESPSTPQQDQTIQEMAAPEHTEVTEAAATAATAVEAGDVVTPEPIQAEGQSDAPKAGDTAPEIETGADIPPGASVEDSASQPLPESPPEEEKEATDGQDLSEGAHGAEEQTTADSDVAAERTLIAEGTASNLDASAPVTDDSAKMDPIAKGASQPLEQGDPETSMQPTTDERIPLGTSALADAPPVLQPSTSIESSSSLPLEMAPPVVKESTRRRGRRPPRQSSKQIDDPFSDNYLESMSDAVIVEKVVQDSTPPSQKLVPPITEQVTVSVVPITEEPSVEAASQAPDTQPAGKVEDKAGTALNDSPVEDIAAAAAAPNDSPVEYIAATTPNDSPVEDIAASASNDSPVEDIAATALNDSPVEDIAATASNDSPVEDITATASNDSQVEDIAANTSGDSPVEDIAAIALNDSPVEDIAATASNDSPVEDIAATASNDSPVEDIAATASNDSRVEDIAANTSGDSQVEDIAATASNDPPVEDIAANTSNDSPVEDIAATAPSDSPVEVIAATASNDSQVEDMAVSASNDSEADSVQPDQSPATDVADSIDTGIPHQDEPEVEEDTDAPEKEDGNEEVVNASSTCESEEVAASATPEPILSPDDNHKRDLEENEDQPATECANEEGGNSSEDQPATEEHKSQPVTTTVVEESEDRPIVESSKEEEDGAPPAQPATEEHESQLVDTTDVATEEPDGAGVSTGIEIRDDGEPETSIELTELGPPSEILKEAEPAEPVDLESDLARALAREHQPEKLEISGETETFLVMPEIAVAAAKSLPEEPRELPVEVPVLDTIETAEPGVEEVATQSTVEIPVQDVVVTAVENAEPAVEDFPCEAGPEVKEDVSVPEVSAAAGTTVEIVEPSRVEEAEDSDDDSHLENIEDWIGKPEERKIPVELLKSELAAASNVTHKGKSDDSPVTAEAESMEQVVTEKPEDSRGTEDPCVATEDISPPTTSRVAEEAPANATAVEEAPLVQANFELSKPEEPAEISTLGKAQECPVVAPVPAEADEKLVPTATEDAPSSELVEEEHAAPEESEVESMVILDDVPAAVVTISTSTKDANNAAKKLTLPQSPSLEEMLSKTSFEEQVFASVVSPPPADSPPVGSFQDSRLASSEDLANIQALVQQREDADREQMAMLNADDAISEATEATPAADQSEKQRLEDEANRILQEHKKKHTGGKLTKKEQKEKEKREKKERERAKKEAKEQEKAAKGKRGIMSGLFGRGKRKSSSTPEAVVIGNDNAVDGKQKAAAEAAARAEASKLDETPPSPSQSPEPVVSAATNVFDEEDEEGEDESLPLPPPPGPAPRISVHEEEEDNDGDVEDEGEQEDDNLGALPSSGGPGRKSSKRDRFMSADAKYMEKVQEAVQQRLDRVEAIGTALLADPLKKQEETQEAFRGAGVYPGLEMWRLKGKALTKITDNFHRLTPVDAAIYLRTKPTVGAQYVIHMWSGRGTPEAAIPTLLSLAQELEASLPGLAVLHKETQFHESPLFLSYFKEGLRVQRAILPKDKRRLLHIQGIHHIAVNEVEVTYKSLNKGDVFILETKKKIFVWLGSASIDKQRLRAIRLADEIAEERGGLPVRTVREGSDNAAFWLGIGSRGVIRPAPGKGIHKVDRKKQKVRLFQMVGAGEKGRLKVTEEKTRPLQYSMLPSDGSVILDTDFGVFIRVGAGAGQREVKNAFKSAGIFIHMRGYPAWAPIICIREHGETSQFKEHFLNWPEVDPSMVASRAGLPSDLVVEPSSMIDRGIGQVKTWTLEGKKRVLGSLDQYGKLRSSDSYIIHYTYRVDEAPRHVIYTWHGVDSSREKRGVAAVNAEQLANEYAKDGVLQVRLTQGSETQHFLNIFKGQLAILMAPPGRRRSQPQAESRLFLVKGKVPLRIVTEQVPCRTASLNSSHAFLLITAKGNTMAWAGKGSTQAERRAAVGIARVVGQKGKEPQRILEGEETQLFWHAIGGRAAYSTAVQLETPSQPLARLFVCCIFGERLTTEEIFHFSQADLYEKDIMLLDASTQIFMWVGQQYEGAQTSQILKMGIDFLDTDQQGRTSDNVPINIVYQCNEPVTFTSQFAGWNERFWNEEPATVENEEARVVGKRDSLASIDMSGMEAELAVPSTSASPEPPALETQLEETPSAVNLAAMNDFVPDAAAAMEVIDRHMPVPLPEEVEVAQAAAAVSVAEIPPVPEEISAEPPTPEESAKSSAPPSTLANEQPTLTAADHEVTDGGQSTQTVKEEGSDDTARYPYNVLQQQLDSHAKTVPDSSEAATSLATGPEAVQDTTESTASANNDTVSSLASQDSPQSVEAAPEIATAGQVEKSLSQAETAQGSTPTEPVKSPEKKKAKKHRPVGSEDSFPMPDLDTLDILAQQIPDVSHSAPTTLIKPSRLSNGLQDLMDSSGMVGADLDSIMDCLTTSSINLFDEGNGDESADFDLEKVMENEDGTFESGGLAPLEVRVSGRRNLRLKRSPSDTGVPPSRLLDSDDASDTSKEHQGVRRSSSSASDPQRQRKKKVSKQRLLEGPETVKINVYRDGFDKPIDVGVTPGTTAQHVVFKMVERTRTKLQMTLCLVEVIPSLHLERRLEDHEIVLDVCSKWSPDSGNMLMFRNVATKYALFEKPQLPLEVLNSICDEDLVPDVESVLQEKAPLKKSWRKRFFQLQRLGLFANTSTDEKSLTKKEPMGMLVPFSDHGIFTPYGSDKENVGPTRFVFYLKPNSSDDRANLTVLCAANAEEFVQWIASIRMMKYGSQLRSNYNAVRNQFIAMAKMKKQLSRQGMYGVKPARH